MTGRDDKARREEKARRTIQELHENFARAAPGRALVEQLYAKHEKELEKIGEAQTMAWAMEEARQRFTLTARDDTYVARGASDMKGFLALAINRFAKADVPRLRHQLALLFTHDEETGTQGAKRLVEEPDGIPPLPRATIIGEPTGLRVLRMHKGHLRLRLTFTGVPAHSGLPLLIDGVPQPRLDSNALRVDALFSYEPTPGTAAFLGYGASLDNGRSFGLDALERQSDGFFLKLAYLFRR